MVHVLAVTSFSNHPPALHGHLLGSYIQTVPWLLLLACLSHATYPDRQPLLSCRV